MTPAEVCLRWQRLHTNLNLSSLAEMFPSLCVNMPMLSREEGGVAGAPRALCHASSAMRSFICAFGRAFFVILSSTMRHLLYVLCYASFIMRRVTYPVMRSHSVYPLPCVLCLVSFAMRPLPCGVFQVSSVCHASSAMHHAQLSFRKWLAAWQARREDGTDAFRFAVVGERRGREQCQEEKRLSGLFFFFFFIILFR